VVRNWFACAGEPPSFASVASADQYFPRDVIELATDEVFVDGGAFTGDTLTEFLRRTEGRFSRINAYEIDEGCFSGLREMVRSLDDGVRERVHPYNLGLYDCNGDIGYVANGTSSAVSSAAAAERARVVRLSDHCSGQRVSFVKMDIEGAEVKALHGAAETVRDCAPKLAVCVYHEPSHLWEVPLLAKDLLEEYRVYLRHHSTDVWETVCYAVPR
jgi:FkbM family methyltransferase